MFRELNHNGVILGSALSSLIEFRVKLKNGISHVLISKGKSGKQLSNLS